MVKHKCFTKCVFVQKSDFNFSFINIEYFALKFGVKMMNLDVYFPVATERIVKIDEKLE